MWTELFRSGAEFMQTCSTLFAYFGPEVQFPLTSLIGAVSGFMLIIGAAPVRLLKDWLQRVRQSS